MGKSTLLRQMAATLKEVDRLNVLEFNWPRKDQSRIKQDLFQLTKNIVLIDNAELCHSETVSMVERIRSTNVEASFCIATAQPQQGELFRNRFSTMEVIEVRLVPLDSEEINNYMMKSIAMHSFSAKKEFVEQVQDIPKAHLLLGTPFYLSLFCHKLSSVPEGHSLSQKDLTRYSLLK